MASLRAALLLLLSPVSAERPLAATSRPSYDASYTVPTERPASVAGATKPKDDASYTVPTERPASVAGATKPKDAKPKDAKPKKKKRKKVDPVSRVPVQPVQRGRADDGAAGRGQCTTPGSCGRDDLPPPGRPVRSGPGPADDGGSWRDDYRDDRGDDNFGDLGGGEENDSSEWESDEVFVDYLPSVEPWPPWDMYEGLTEISETASITTPMQRHLERVMVRHKFSDAYAETMEKMGKYKDGTPAGSPQWIGDHGAQDRRRPAYASFGSILDISTKYSQAWEGSTEFGGKPSWISSLVWRRDILHHAGHEVPCRVDLLDDYDPAADDAEACILGVIADDYVAVRGTNEKKYVHWELSAEWNLLGKGYYVKSSIMDLELKDEDGNERKFDTIVANGALASVDGTHDLDLVLEKMVSFLKPGGVLFLVGIEPLQKQKGPGKVYNDILDVIDSVKGLSGAYPHRNVPATWVNRNLHRLGLNVFSSTVFRVEPSFDDIQETVNEAMGWIEENQASGAIRKQYQKMLSNLMDKARGATRDGPIFAGESQYIVAAELPSDGNGEISPPVEPTIYEPKPAYEVDKTPKIEKLDETPVPRGKMVVHKWANGDPYDGLSARIAIPPQLAPTITQYVKDLGLWDLMIDTIMNDPMPQDSTRFYNVTSPYGHGRNFSWSAKRPDNFYGSASDMHWFDIADEASHEDSLRALSKGGFDEVLNAIGEFLGLDSLVTFSIGLLAVTKADKGYVHIDFEDSGKRAFNFLINLETPGDEPELTVVEEDLMGNFRRAQIKYEPTFGVLNGDWGMHATNECNHRASGGVRLTASIFISDLQEASLEEVANHDNYYFPFGNKDWIWAQRGRHWNKDGTVSLANDKGRRPFEPKDELRNCETKVGPGKEKCWVNGIERKRCYKTCGFFMPDDEFRPGEEREKVFGW